MIILVRHGETNHHTEDLTGGWTDSELTQKGKLQMDKLAGHLDRFLKKKRPEIIASDLRRARQSAQIIAERLDVQFTWAEFLREKNNGEAANKTNTQARLLRLPKQGDDPDNRNYSGGETRREFYDRVAAGMQAMESERSQRPLIIVAHKGTIQNIMFWWLNLSIDEVCKKMVSFNVTPASMSILTVNRWQEHEISLLNYRTGYGGSD